MIDDENFDSEVLKSEVPVLIDFGATWCPPCKAQLPILEEFAASHQEEIKVVKIDIDDSPRSTSRFGIRSIPALMLFNKGHRIDTKVGLTSLAGLTEMLKKVG